LAPRNYGALALLLIFLTGCATTPNLEGANHNGPTIPWRGAQIQQVHDEFPDQRIRRIWKDIVSDIRDDRYITLTDEGVSPGEYAWSDRNTNVVHINVNDMHKLTDAQIFFVLAHEAGHLQPNMRNEPLGPELEMACDFFALLMVRDNGGYSVREAARAIVDMARVENRNPDDPTSPMHYTPSKRYALLMEKVREWESAKGGLGSYVYNGNEDLEMPE
jgi:hypothetical protein